MTDSIQGFNTIHVVKTDDDIISIEQEDGGIDVSSVWVPVWVVPKLIALLKEAAKEVDNGQR